MRREPVRPYHIDLGQKDVREGWYERFAFVDGIPQYPYSSGPQVNPVFVCHYALYRLDRWLRWGDADDRAAFVRLAHWLLDNGDFDDGTFVFYHRYAFGDMKPPWLSALGQGRLMSTFTRAWQVTGEKAFLAAASACLGPFHRGADEGGVQARFPDGGITFEEYPANRPSHVLNGLVTALFGLYDLSAIGGDEEGGALFDEAVAAVAANLHRYDLGYWSAYDLAGRIPTVASDGYHHYHVLQLWVLFEMTGIDVFKRYARRWEAYRRGPRLWFMRNLSRGYRRLPPSLKTRQ